MKRASNNNNNIINKSITLYINKYLIIIGVASNHAVATTYRNLIPSPCHATTGVPGKDGAVQQGSKQDMETPEAGHGMTQGLNIQNETRKSMGHTWSQIKHNGHRKRKKHTWTNEGETGSTGRHTGEEKTETGTQVWQFTARGRSGGLKGKGDQTEGLQGGYSFQDPLAEHGARRVKRFGHGQVKRFGRPWRISSLRGRSPNPNILSRRQTIN